MARVILHIDLNAFFANAEILRYPQYKNKPVVICKNSINSVITTANYIARKYGINSAMPLSIAKSYCSNLIIIDPDFEYYKKISNQFFDLIKEFSPLIEKASIDECYIDITNVISKYSKPLDLVYAIKNKILNHLGLECSIGIAPNKFLAKMASDMLKPNGITILRKKEIQTKLWPLDIKHFHGIGKRTINKCYENHLMTIGDIANADLKLLINIFGKNYAFIIKDRANGRDNDPVEVNNAIKSISTSRNYFDPLSDNNEIEFIINNHILDVIHRLKHNKLSSYTVFFSIGHDHNKPKSYSKKYSFVIDNSIDLKRLVNDIIDDNNIELYNVTFLGVGLLDCVTFEERELSLFDFNDNPSTNDIINKINKIMKKKVLKKGNE